MKRFFILDGAILFLSILNFSAGLEGNGLEFSDDNGGIELPTGFHAVVVADKLGPTRQIAVNENGDIYVALNHTRKGKGIVGLRDESGNGKADRTVRFGAFENGSGIEVHKGFLYYSTKQKVYRFPLQKNELLPAGPAEILVEGFPKQASHARKTFALDDGNGLFVNVGAPSNACQEQSRSPGSPGMDPCPHRKRQAGIWRFAADQSGQTQTDNGEHFATGIRNSVAIAWNPNSHSLYVVQHGRDQLQALWPDFYTIKESAELPAEEFFLVEEGDDFGWPYAYYDPFKNAKMVTPEYGGDGKKTAPEGKYKGPITVFPAHWAPNDLIFYTGRQFPERYRGGAFIAFHGSWNRAPLPQKGYKVVFVPFQGSLSSGPFEIFADGFAGTEKLFSPGSARYRPVGLAEGPDGSLYITDSMKGRVWRVVYTGA